MKNWSIEKHLKIQKRLMIFIIVCVILITIVKIIDLILYP